MVQPIPLTALDRTVPDRRQIMAIGSLPLNALAAAARALHLPALNIAVAGGSAAELSRLLPDLLLLEARAAAADPALLAELARPIHQGMMVAVLAGEGDAEAAAPLLDGRVDAFFSLDTSAEELLAWSASVLSKRTAGHVAEASVRLESTAQIEALRRDAERVAAALAELVAGRAPGTASQPLAAGRIRAHLKARRLRERFLPAELFADPAWDMMLDLTAADLDRQQVSVSSLCIAAAVPTTTGLRWIKALIDRGLLVRTSDPSDARRAFIAIAPPMRSPIAGCIEAVLNYPGQ